VITTPAIAARRKIPSPLPTTPDLGPQRREPFTLSSAYRRIGAANISSAQISASESMKIFFVRMNTVSGTPQTRVSNVSDEFAEPMKQIGG